MAKKKNGTYDKPPVAMKRWIFKQVRYLKGAMFLHSWDIGIKYDMPPEQKIKKNDDGKEETVASVSTDHKYMIATIHIHPAFGRFWAEKKRDYREMMMFLVHEFAHVHTDRMYKFAYEMVPNSMTDYLEELRENETQMIAISIMDLIPEKQYGKSPPRRRR